MKILVVDDFDIARELLVESLLKENPNLIILEASTGEIALEILKQNMDVKRVILDLNLPGIKGMEVLKEIKRLYPFISVNVVSGLISSKQIERALEEGAKSVIIKPFSFDKILSLIS
ncbi:MAG: response regulator [Ignavibacteriales bacterium]